MRASTPACLFTIASSTCFVHNTIGVPSTCNTLKLLSDSSVKYTLRCRCTRLPPRTVTAAKTLVLSMPPKGDLLSEVFLLFPSDAIISCRVDYATNNRRPKSARILHFYDDDNQQCVSCKHAKFSLPSGVPFQKGFVFSQHKRSAMHLSCLVGELLS